MPFASVSLWASTRPGFSRSRNADSEDVVLEKQMEKPTSNIVSLFGNKKVTAQDEQKDLDQTETSKESFMDAMQRNFENQERLRKERLKANQSVLKSYRIKNWSIVVRTVVLAVVVVVLAVTPSVAVKEPIMSSTPSNPAEITKKGKILDFSAFKNKQEINNEFSRARKPLFVNSDKGSISGTSDRAQPVQVSEDFGDRLQKIRSSLERINTLMADLKKLSTSREKDQIN